MDAPQEPTITGWILIVLSLFLLGLEIVVIAKGKETISHAIWKAAKWSMPVTFIIGFLCGHWFW